MSQSHQLSWTTEYGDLRDAVGWALWHRRRTLLVTVRVLIAVVALLWLGSAALSHDPQVLFLLIIVCYAPLAFFVPHLAAWGTWNVAKKALRRGTSAVVSDECLLIRNGSTEARYGWADLLAPARSGRVWVFPLAYAKAVVYVPVRAVTGLDEDVIAFARARIDAVRA